MKAFLLIVCVGVQALDSQVEYQQGHVSSDMAYFFARSFKTGGTLWWNYSQFPLVGGAGRGSGQPVSWKGIVLERLIFRGKKPKTTQKRNEE